jgi:hypothetical protein
VYKYVPMHMSVVRVLHGAKAKRSRSPMLMEEHGHWVHHQRFA